MEEVRRDLDEDVQDTVEGVRELGDWRSYVKAYPWCFLGAAFATGYLMTRRLRLQSQPIVESNDERGNAPNMDSLQPCFCCAAQPSVYRAFQ